MTKKVSTEPLIGYPVTNAFKSAAKLRAYMDDGDRIQCLLCGRRYKALGHHLRQSHDMTADDYKEAYGIPWTYGLVCGETSEKISKNVKQMIADGIICCGDVDMQKVGSAPHRARMKVLDDINTENLEEANKGFTGEYSRRKAAAPKLGSAEHHENMVNRPQCSSPEAKERLRTIWKGKKRDKDGKMIRQPDTRKENE